jgi:hypothetical protein
MRQLLRGHFVLGDERMKQRHDRLLAALITKLPPATAPWRREERIAWLRMMTMAFNVVYGACAAVPVAPGEPQTSGGPCDSAAVTKGGRIGIGSAGDSGDDDAPGSIADAASPAIAAAPILALARQTSRQSGRFRFYVDHDGFAMGDDRPIGIEDLPEDAILWDERTGLECGDLTTILWRDIGTTRRSLPRGVILKAATAAI